MVGSPTWDARAPANIADAAGFQRGTVRARRARMNHRPTLRRPHSLVLLLVAVTGCSWQGEVHHAAIHDLACPEDQIQVERLTSGNPSRFLARGCGREVEYWCAVQPPPESLQAASDPGPSCAMSQRPRATVAGAAPAPTAQRAETEPTPPTPCEAACRFAGESCSGGCTDDVCEQGCAALTRGCAQGCAESTSREAAR
jgi:hypothetical protein